MYQPMIRFPTFEFQRLAHVLEAPSPAQIDFRPNFDSGRHGLTGAQR
jgi:hypothetical protein